MTHAMVGLAKCETSDFERSGSDFELLGIWTVSELRNLVAGRAAKCHVESQSALKAEFLSASGMGYSGIYIL